MLFDAHFHLDLMDNMRSLIRDFSSADIGVLAVGTTPKAYERELQFCGGVENIQVGLGLHPQLIADRQNEIELFLRLARDSKFIGEVGLDFNSDYISSKDQQLSVFRKIAKVCADEGGKILSLHSIKSSGVVIDELCDAGVFKTNICVFHWFTGRSTERKQAIRAGAYFSINSRMLKTKGGQETIKTVPRERILLETDAPFTMQIRSVSELKMAMERLVESISEIRGENMRRQIEVNSAKVFL